MSLDFRARPMRGPDDSVAQRRRTSVPYLENGDRLDRAEFLRRWEAMPRLKNAELIKGVVSMAAALRAWFHGEPHVILTTWMGYYAAMTPGVEAGDNSTMLLDELNAPQPDVYLRLSPERGGQSHLDELGYLTGAPELIVEIAASSASIDLHDKREIYERFGVREYLVWRVLEDSVDLFQHDGNALTPVVIPSDGCWKSSVFPGLWLNLPAVLRRDAKSVLETLQLGLATPEARSFSGAGSEE